jgi:tetratricopeptide (TPR) repeat protein
MRKTTRASGGLVALAARVALVAKAMALALAVAGAVGCAGSVPLPRKAIDLNAAGAQALAQGDLRAAEARLSVALEYSPRFVEAWVNLGYVELRRGSFEQARRDFLRARELNQDIPAPHHALGVLAEKELQGARAEAHYRAALKVDPGFSPARANLARLLYARGQYENAREQFERLVEVAPEATEGWVGEAEALLQLGREADADAVVARARARLGDSPPLRILVARGRMALGEWDEAEAMLASLVADADRTRAEAAWAWIAVARVGRGDAPGAEQAARAALAVDRADPIATYALRLAAGITGGGETPSPQAPR